MPPTLNKADIPQQNKYGKDRCVPVDDDASERRDEQADAPDQPWTADGESWFHVFSAHDHGHASVSRSAGWPKPMPKPYILAATNT